jgi:hypothetical protein
MHVKNVQGVITKQKKEGKMKKASISILLFFAVIAVPISEAGLTDGLIAHYKFDGTAEDSSVSENDGTISGGVSFTQGILNQAACFNGIDGYVEAPYHPSLSLIEWSISAWVYPKDMPIDSILVGREDDSQGKYNYALVLGPDSFIGQYETASSEFDHYVTATGVTSGEWYQVVVVRTVLGSHRIYLNGILMNENTWNDTPVQNLEKLIIARYVDSYPNLDRFFNGCLDDVRIYNRGLSDTEIQTLYNPTISVSIDIKPGSNPNSINLKSNGVVPVAILSTIDFAATVVDPDTVFFADASPVKWTMEDINQDGDMDLLLHFRTQDLNLTQDSTEATLTGETKEGTHITGTDTVNIVPKKNN